MPSAKYPVIIALAAIFLYIITLNHGYVYDDEIVIVKNSYVQQGLAGIPDIWTNNYLSGVNNYNDGLYRPISPSTFAIEQAFFGANPAVSHLINVLLYACIGLIIFFLVKALTQHQVLAFVVSLIFLVHPIHTEVVANIKSRDELLAGLFAFGALWYTIRFPKIDFKNLLVIASLFVMAILSKESAVAFAIVIPMFYWFRNKQINKSLGILTCSLVLIAGGWFGFHQYLIASMPSDVDQSLFSEVNNVVLMADNLADQVATGCWITLVYLYKCLVPHPLVSDYSSGVIHVVPFFSIQNALVLGLLVLLIAFSLWQLRKGDIIAVGILTFFILLAPVSNIFFPIGTTIGERLVFSPSFGVVLVLGTLIIRWEWKGKFQLAGACMVIFALLTVIRVGEWESNLTLFNADVKKHPESYRTHYNYATALSETIDEKKDVRENEKLFSEAIFHFKEALLIRPDYTDAYNNLGDVYRKSDDHDLAIVLYEKLLKDNPDYSKAYYNLAITLYEKQDYQNAHRAFHDYISSSGGQKSSAWYLAGICSGFASDFSRAIEELNKSVELEPSKWDAWNFMGMAYGNLNDWNKAVIAFERAYSLNKDPDILENLNKAKINERAIASL